MDIHSFSTYIRLVKQFLGVQKNKPYSVRTVLKSISDAIYTKVNTHNREDNLDTHGEVQSKFSLF